MPKLLLFQQIVPVTLDNIQGGVATIFVNQVHDQEHFFSFSYKHLLDETQVNTSSFPGSLLEPKREPGNEVAQGVVTYMSPTEAFATVIKFFDRQKVCLIA